MYVQRREVKSFCWGSKACFVAKINQCLFLGVMGSWTLKAAAVRVPTFRVKQIK